jgi:GcrA cell cycle regulator
MSNRSDPIEWTPKVVLSLRQLWDEGHSTAEIGRRLGVSKNAVVGKAHRLDLPSRP